MTAIEDMHALLFKRKNDQLRYCRRRLSKKLMVSDYHILYTKGWAANAAQAITHQQCYGEALSHRAMLYSRQKKLPLGKKTLITTVRL